MEYFIGLPFVDTSNNNAKRRTSSSTWLSHIQFVYSRILQPIWRSTYLAFLQRSGIIVARLIFMANDIKFPPYLCDKSICVCHPWLFGQTTTNLRFQWGERLKISAFKARGTMQWHFIYMQFHSKNEQKDITTTI